MPWAANRRRQRVALLTDRASMDKDERERGSAWPVMISANTAPRHSSRRLGPGIPIVIV